MHDLCCAHALRILAVGAGGKMLTPAEFDAFLDHEADGECPDCRLLDVAQRQGVYATVSAEARLRWRLGWERIWAAGVPDALLDELESRDGASAARVVAPQC